MVNLSICLYLVCLKLPYFIKTYPMRLYVLFFLLLTGFHNSYARLGIYTKVVEERVAWEPVEGKNGPAITVLVRIKHDAFFGDANESHIAGKYELGSYVVYKGQRISTSSLPE